MQKVIEAARNIQTPFMQQPVIKPATPIIPPVVAVQPIQENKKDETSSLESKSKEDSKSSSKSSSRHRRRSRSRTRSRERDRKDRDRSRDRRDRRRRDRSRSRDRRDKRRDRKDRSKSRERTRSRERDYHRGKDKKRDRSVERNVDQSTSNSSHSDANDPPKQPLWERNNGPRMPMNVPTQNQNAPSLLGNYPGLLSSSLEDARRSLGLLTGLQNPPVSNQPPMMNMQENPNPLPRNNIRRDWQMDNKSNISDRPSMMMDKPSMAPSMAPVFTQMNTRPMLSQPESNYGKNQRNTGNMYQSNFGPRPSFNQEMGNTNFNRPFMNRPLPDFMQPTRNSPDYSQKKDNMNDNPYKRDFRNRNDDNNDGDEIESCIQLRPYWGGYGDLRRFFHGLYISNTGIKVVRENNGRRTGVVYVKFVRPESKPMALLKTGMPLKGYNVDIISITNEEFDKYGMPENESDEDREGRENETAPIQKTPFTCLVVEDIPNFAKEHDMLKMFSDYSLLGIDIQSKNRHRNAYIQFNKEEDAEKALQEADKHVLGGKKLIVRACTDRQFANSDIELEHKQEPEEMEPPIEIEDDLIIKDEENPDQQSSNTASFDTDVILLTGMPPKTTDRDVIDFFSDIGLVPNRIHMLVNKFGPTGECYCEFGSPDEAISALDKNGMPLGTGIVTVELFPRKDMEMSLGMNANNGPPMNHIQNRFAGRLGPRPMLGMHPRPPMMPNRMMGHHPMNQGMMGPHGCTLAMENVPFKAGIDEILDFFGNFEVSHQNVLRRYNDNGTPTGDARVTFNSPAEARRAFEECKFKKIRDRTIYLRIM